ncbi:MAG: CoA transferase [Acidimicrobiia bacterium]|nr:CoA transferase [Acidimicrobiia bacterium]MCY4432830.1 CoA transferase [bacterium]
MVQQNSLPLDGMRVLELSTEVPGGYCGKLLLDAGAEVLKAEPTGGDPLRRYAPLGAPVVAGKGIDGDHGLLFGYLAAGKRSVETEDRDHLLTLAAGADIIIQDAPPGRLSWEQVQTANPAASLVSISPWGTDGPWADRPATEFIVHAASGSLTHRGDPEGEPIMIGGRFAEFVFGSYAAVGAMSGWLCARSSGWGQHVDLSTVEAGILSMGGNYELLAGQFGAPPMTRMVSVPSVERCADGWVGFSTITGQQWLDFCSMIGRPDWHDDEELMTAPGKIARADEISEATVAWTGTRTVAEAVEVASALRIPCAPIGTGRTVPTTDHFAARESFVDNPDGHPQPRPPYRIGGMESPPPRRAPVLDAHADSPAWEPRPRNRPLGNPSDLPLAGLRVAAFTAFWAGPLVTSYLASLGADVIKVESIQRPDGMRFAGWPQEKQRWEYSYVTHGANAGVRNVTLDLERPAGMDLAKRLIADADIVVENFSARVMDHFGLGWQEVHRLNPQAVMLRMPAFGLDGPWKDRVGFAMTIEQASGLVWVTGYEDLPMLPRGACDPLGAMHAIFAALLALRRREQTGEGQFVEVALVDAALATAAEQFLEWSAHGVELGRSVNASSVCDPQGVFQCAGDDAWVALSCATDAQRAALAEKLKADGFDQDLEGWAAARSPAEAEAALLAAAVPASVLPDPRNLLPHPQLEYRGFVEWMDHPICGELGYPGFPFVFSGLGGQLLPRPAPALGQHNREILRNTLGLDDDAIAALADEDIIGDWPIGWDK